MSDAPTAGAFRSADDGARWAYAGKLTFENAESALASSAALPLPTLGVVDLGGLEHAAAAALAVLVAGTARLAALKVRAGATGRAARTLLVGAGTGAAGLLLASLAAATAGLEPALRAREATLAVLAGFLALHALLLVCTGAFVLARERAGFLASGRVASLDCLERFAWFTALAAAITTLLAGPAG